MSSPSRCRPPAAAQCGPESRSVRPRPLPPSLALSPFSAQDAREAGVPPHRLRAADLSSPHHGVRTTVAPESIEQRAAALGVLLCGDEYFSHVTALALWHLPLPTRHEGGALHVTGSTTHQRRRPGVRGHRLARVPRLHSLGGLRVVDPVEAWVQSAPLLSVDELVQVGDALAGRWSRRGPGRGRGRAGRGDTVGRAHRRPGVVRLSAASEWLRAGVMSPRETLLRLMIERAGLPRLDVDVKRWTASRAYLGRPDLSDGRRKVAVEFEGDGHRTDRRQWRRDIERAARFVDDGWAYHRVTDDHLRGPLAAAFLGRLARDLDERP
jgi:hypothetical protein